LQLASLKIAFAGQLTADDRHKVDAIITKGFKTRCLTYWLWHWRNHR